jgi:predicted amidohydrolase YtcJ
MTSGEIPGPRERLTRLDALRALTVGGACLRFAERERCVFAPGRQADLAVLEENPLTMPLAGIKSLACRLTMVGGRVVHGEN